MYLSMNPQYNLRIKCGVARCGAVGLNMRRCEGTIMTTPVEDPSKYGVVLSKKDGQIEVSSKKGYERSHQGGT